MLFAWRGVKGVWKTPSVRLLEAQEAVLICSGFCNVCIYTEHTNTYSARNSPHCHTTKKFQLPWLSWRATSNCLASDLSDDSWCIPTLHVDLCLEAAFPTHLQSSYFPKKRFQGRQFAAACSVSPWVRAGALPPMQEAAVSLARQFLRIINYLDDLCGSLRCSLPQILAIYRQDSVISTQFPIFGCQTSLEQIQNKNPCLIRLPDQFDSQGFRSVSLYQGDMDHFLIRSRRGVLLCSPIGKAFLLEDNEVENRTWVAQEGHSLAVSHTADVDTIHLEKQTNQSP